MTRLSENPVLVLKTTAYAVTAEVEGPAAGARGTVAAQGGAFGGRSRYAPRGALAYRDTRFGLRRFTVAAAAPPPAGRHQVRAEFAADGGGVGKGGTATRYVDGAAAGRGRVDSTVPFTFSMDETPDVGRETGTTVADAYGVRDSAFTGTIHRVRLDAGRDRHDHLVDPQHRLHIALTRP